MSEMDQKRQIVQDGLNKRKAKRKQAEIDAEHEALTMQMISIINQNARNAEIKKRAKRAERAKRKARNLFEKKTIAIKTRNNEITMSLFAVGVALLLAITLYVTSLTEMWSLIMSAALLMMYAVFNIYALIKNANQLKKLRKESLAND